MIKLRVEAVENGFVVYSEGIEGKMWVFESAANLSKFVLDWGKGNEKVKIDRGAIISSPS